MTIKAYWFQINPFIYIFTAANIANFKFYLFINLLITWIFFYKNHAINKKINIICPIKAY